MPWWAALIQLIGLPALKFALMLLEKKYPGLKPLIDQILKFIGEGGGTATELQTHLEETVAGFADPKLMQTPA